MSDDVPLPAVWVVGLTGHRRLKNEEAVRALIREQVEVLSRTVRGRLTGCSSAAIGADTLFAETCAALNVPWKALLPFSTAEFKTDFSETQWAHAAELLAGAVETEVSGSAEDRTAAYLRCGLRTVDEADVMIAVWNGLPARGVGGTGDVVRYARQEKKPLILIHPENLRVEHERLPEAFSDPALDFLNDIAVARGAVPDNASGKAQVEHFFREVDAVATRIAPRFRRWVAVSLVMNTAAVALTAAVIGLGLKSPLLDLLALFLVAAATLAILYVKRQGAHETWMRCRVAAEMCRSALATWEFPTIVTPFWFQELPALGRLGRSLRYLRLSNKPSNADSVAEIKEHYLATRIGHQIEYFSERSRSLHLVLLVLTTLFWFFSIVAIGRGILVATAGTRWFSPELGRIISSFLPFALPLIAGCALSLISIFDLHRQLARSKDMKLRLIAFREQIVQSDNLVTLQNAVEKVEKLFAEEFLEWFVLSRDPRFQ
jgi:SMODS and SLOG-associating 2TM effector domain 3